MSKTPPRRAELFQAYAGVIYQQDGPKAVQLWIEELIKYSQSRDHEGKPTRLEVALPYHKADAAGSHIIKRMPSGSADSSSTLVETRKRPRLEADTSVSTSASVAGTAASHAPHAADAADFIPSIRQIQQPTLPSPSPRPITSLGDSQDIRSPVSLIHERCQRMGVSLEWAFAQAGQSHTPQWTASLTCKQIGLATMGISTSKQAAKEEAARRALIDIEETALI